MFHLMRSMLRWNEGSHYLTKRTGANRLPRKERMDSILPTCAPCATE